MEQKSIQNARIKPPQIILEAGSQPPSVIKGFFKGVVYIIVNFIFAGTFFRVKNAQTTYVRPRNIY